MAESLKLSIITPSYNHCRFLEQTILSIINQDYSNIEYIIIDGASKDDSVEIICKYEKHIAYWVSEPDNGPQYALHAGMKQATGDVVAWQNADDYYEPNVFGSVMKIFCEHPDVDLVYGNVRLVDESNQTLRELRFVPTNHWSMLFEGFMMNNQAVFFRRTLWDRMGGVKFTDGYAYDYDLFLRATHSSQRLYFIHRTFGNYRVHANSLTFGAEQNRLKSGNTDWVIRRRYLGKWGWLPTAVFRPIALLAFVRRMLWHMWLGDWSYLASGFRRRVLRQPKFDVPQKVMRRF